MNPGSAVRFSVFLMSSRPLGCDFWFSGSGTPEQESWIRARGSRCSLALDIQWEDTRRPGSEFRGSSASRIQEENMISLIVLKNLFFCILRMSLSTFVLAKLGFQPFFLGIRVSFRFHNIFQERTDFL